MKPTIPTQDCDPLRWFIVGACQAGASESQIVSMTGLPRFTIHNAVSSFKKTGNPTVKRRKNKKRTAKMDSLQYDEWTDTEGEDSDDSFDCADRERGSERQEIAQLKGPLHQKRSPFKRKPKHKPTATDTIDYILDKGRIHEEKRISSRRKSQKQNECQNQDYHSDSNREPASPLPHLFEPLSPTSQLAISTKFAVDVQHPNPSMDEVSSSSPCTPITSEYHHDGQQLQKTLSHHFNLAHKTNVWSRKDDKILLQHVLTRMGRWDELDRLFDGRHSDADCMERWHILQHYLFKRLQKNGTNDW